MSTLEEIEIAVRDGLRRLKSDRSLVLGQNTIPIGDLGLASVDGVDLALDLEERLSIKIPENQNPFVDDQTYLPRTVGQIIGWLSSLRVEAPQP